MTYPSCVLSQFYEDVMIHGHPSAVDDSGLEAGNHLAKVGKRNLFWGGTSEPGAIYEMQRSTGKHDAAGELIMMTVISRANVSLEQQHLQNTFLRQLFAMKRDVQERSIAVRMQARIKGEQYAAQCDVVAASLVRLEAAVSAVLDNSL